MDPVVFLDRDNTLVRNDTDLGDPDAVHLLPGVADGLRRLKETGFRLVVATNQGGVARGRFSEADVDRVHTRIAKLVDDASGGHRVLDRFYYCPFHPEGSVSEYRREHPWRKPQPGMLLQAANDMRLDLDRAWIVGDQARDIAAGRAAGCRTVLVLREGAPPSASHDTGADFVANSFADAVETILSHRHTDAADAARRAAERARSQMEFKPPPAATATATAALPRHLRERDRRRRRRRAAGPALEPLRRALLELVEEVRSDRTRREEFGPLRIVAAGLQIGAVVLAMFALLELDELALFAKWMGGALLAQLATIALLLFDGR